MSAKPWAVPPKLIGRAAGSQPTASVQENMVSTVWPGGMVRPKWSLVRSSIQETVVPVGAVTLSWTLTVEPATTVTVVVWVPTVTVWPTWGAGPVLTTLKDVGLGWAVVVVLTGLTRGRPSSPMYISC